MPYIGRELERGTYLKLDDISSSFDGNETIFNLTKGGDPFFPGSPQSIIVSINGTILEPVTEYGIDSSKIVFATAPTAGHAFFSITLGLPFGVFDNGSIEDGSLTGVKLSNPFNYDGGLLFLNSLTDKVGIRTENPTHDLDVHGDVRIVGILTVGTSSLTLDGSNNKIQVGTALTLSHSDGAIIGNSHLHSTGYDLKDNTRIRLGNSNDFQIYHTTSGTEHNRVDSGSKQLRILSSNQIQLNTGTEHMAKFIADAAVELYHGMGSGTGAEKKFETSTTGATVTGKLVVTGDLDVQGTTTTLDTTLTEVDKLEVGADNVTVGVAITQSGTGDALTIDDGTSRVLTVKDGGSVRIGDNASYTPATGAEDLVVGALTGNNNGITIITGSGNQTGSLSFADSASGNPGAIFYRHTDNTMLFRVSGGTRMSIKGTSGGKVGIGTTNPKSKLHAYNGTPSDIGGVLVSNVNYDSNQDKPYLIVGTKGWTGATTNWNTFGFQHKIKVNSGGVPKLTIDSVDSGSEVELFTFKNGGLLGIGVTEPTGKLHLPDGGHLKFGNDDDMRIYHSGSLGVIANKTGDLYIQANQDGDVGGDIYIRAKAGENSILCEDDGAVFLYNDGAPKFRTYSEGIQVLSSEGGNASILLKADEADDNNDTYRIIAGDGTNLNFQSYATGSYVTSLRLTGDGNGAVELNHAGTKRLETTNTGVSITDNLNVAGISTFNGLIDSTANIQIRNIAPILKFAEADNSKNYFIVGDSNSLSVRMDGTGGSDIIQKWNSNGTHSFYNKVFFNGDVDALANLDVDGQTDLDVLNVAELATFAGITTVTGETLFTKQFNVAGVSTFSDHVHVATGKSLVLNSPGNINNPVIKINGHGPNIIRFASDAGGTVDADSIDLAYRTTPNTIAFRRSSDAAEFLTVDADDGLVTVSNNLNVTGDLDVDGQIDLDDLAVAGVSTFSADVNVGDGSADARILIKKADNDEADHIQFYNGTTRMGEIGCLDNSWLRINHETNKPIYTPRYIRADAGFFVDGTAKGINGSGNFIGGTIAGASDYDTLLRSDASDTMNGVLTVGGSHASANEGGEIRLTLAPNSTLNGTLVIDNYIDKLRIFEGSGGTARGAEISLGNITGITGNEILSSGLTGVDYTVTHLRSFNLPNGVVAISTSNASHIPLTVTNSGGAGNNTILAKFVGDSDGLEIRNTAAGDYRIRNSAYNNGIAIFDGTGGVDITYNDSRKLTVKSGGTSLNDELTFENDDEGLTTFGGGRFYKQNGGGIVIRQSSGNQTPVIENNAGTLQGTILHTGNASSQLTQFLRADQSDQMNGVLTVSSTTHQKLILAGSNNPKITLQEGTTDKASIEWSTSGYLDIKNEEHNESIRLQSGSNGLKYLIDGSTNTVIHTGNANSNLTQFLRADANDTFTGTLTAGQDGKIAFPDNTTVPDDPTSQQHDYITFGAHGSISQVSGRGALMITSSDDSLILANGDVGRAFTSSHINVDPEDVFVLSDGKFVVKTDLQEGFGTEHTLQFDNTGSLTVNSGKVIHEAIGFNPYDVVHAYNNSDADSIRFNLTEMAIELQSSDTSIGMAFPAFRVNTNTGEKFKLSVQIRSAASTTNGIYIRVYEYDAELPDGKTHISNDASSNAVVQEDTRNASISPTFENQAGDTDWRTKTFTYTPTSTAVWASLVVLNWSGHGTNSLYVRDLKRERDLSSVGVSTANQLVLGNDSSGSTPRRLVFASADTGTVTIQADTSSGATYTPSTGTITAQNFSGSGSAISNVNAAKVVVSDESSDTTCHPLFATTNTGNAEVKVGSNLSFNSSTGALTATSFVGDIIGNTTIDGNLIFAQGHVAQMHNIGTRDKYRVWSNSTYAIGMDDAMTYGSLSNYAMTFQVDNTNSMGWVFLDDAHSDSQGAMSLSTNGKMNIAHSLRVGYGENDTTNAGTNGRLDVSGQIQATSQIIAGRGGGGVALTINDGHGNANVCFNHNGGVPEQDGASGRIEVNTDTATANAAFMKLQLKSAVTGGTAVSCTDVLNLMSNSTAAPFRLGFLTTSPEATFHIESNHAASDVPTMKLSEFRPSIHFEDTSTSATDWEILCDHNDISNALQFRSGDSSSENKLSHLEYRMDHSGFHIGNSDGDRQRKLYLHAGAAANDMAELYCSNGNLHIDAETGHHMYLNHYQGNEVRLNYGGGGNSGLKLKTQSTGVQVTGQLALTANNPNIRFDDSDTTNNAEITLDNTQLRIEVDEDQGTDNSAIRFRVDGDDKAIIDANGKLGINVDSPEGMLHINENGSGPAIFIENAGSTEGDIAIDSDDQIQIGHWNKSTNTYTNRLNINAAGTIFRIIPAETRIEDGTQGSPAINFNSDQDTGIYRPGSNSFAISVGNNTAFRIDSDKRLMVGHDAGGATTGNDRNATLYVRNQNSQKVLALRSTSSGTDMIDIWSNKLDDGDGTDDDTVHLLAFRVGSGTGLKGSVVYQEGTGQTLYSVGSSDRRLKENIVGIDNAIDVIKQLRPVNFNFNKLFYNNSDIKHARAKTVSGFIADEVQTLIPQAVMGEKDAVYNEDDPDTGAKKGEIISQQMDMTKMIPHLTKALQEAITKIETLEAEVTALKAKVG